MTDKSTFSTGDVVISPNFGIGRVVGTEFIESVGGDVYIIERGRDQSRLMVPKQQEDQIRLTVTEGEIISALDIIANINVEPKEFPSRKDRVEYFKSKQRCIQMDELCEAIVEMYEIPAKGKVESQIYEQMLETFLLELVEVTDLNEDQAKAKIESILENRS